MGARGKFISLEGVDGAGKSSHIGFLADCIRAAGHEVVVTREPGGSPLAEALRGLVLNEPMNAVTETLLMFAARSDHVQTVIEPALAAGRWVLCDRFTDATLAYQGAGKGVDRGLIESLAGATHAGLKPDLTLLFDVPWETARERLALTGKQPDRFEREERPFFERVREAYLDLSRRERNRIRVMDARKGLTELRADVEEIVATLWPK